MGVKVTGQFEPAGDFSIVDGADVSGNITGSNISASGTVFASQFTGDGSALTGVVSGTDISGSWQGHLSSSKVTFGGDIRVAGDVVAERYVGSSSVTHLTQSFSSGSTIFGDTIDDTHKVTGSMTITGSLGVNRTVSGRGDVEIAGDYHNFPSGNGQLAILSNISASNASGSDQGGQIVFGGPISDSDLTRTFGLIAGLKENSTENNRAGYLAFGTRRGDGDRDIHEHIKITSTGDLLFGVTNDGNKISGSSTSTGSFGEVHVADKLGIQTTTPRGPIDVLGSNGSQGFYLSSTGLKAYLPTDIAHSGGSSTFDFQVANLRLGTSTQGTVSIYPRFNSILQLGTQDDTNLLTLSGSTQISGSSTSTGSFGAGYIDNKLGIGISAPTHKLHVLSTDNKAFLLDRNTGNNPTSLNEFSSYYSLSIKKL